MAKVELQALARIKAIEGPGCSWALQRGLVDRVATPKSSLPSSLPLSPGVLTTEEAAGVRLRVVTGNPYSDIARPSSG